MNSCKIRVLKQWHKVCFGCFLKCHDSRRLEAEIRLHSPEVSFVYHPMYVFKSHLEILCNLSNKSLEWQLSNKQFCRFLVSSNFTKCNCSWTESMRLLHSSSRLYHSKQTRPPKEQTSPTDAAAVFRADFAASCLRGALPPVDLRAVCLVRAIAQKFSYSLVVVWFWWRVGGN
jgi:hypothetical protein